MNNGSVKLQAEDNQTLPEAATNIANNLITELDRMIAEMSNTANIKAKGITTTEALKQKKDLQAVRAELLNNMKDPKFQADGLNLSYKTRIALEYIQPIGEEVNLQKVKKLIDDDINRYQEFLKAQKKCCF